MDIFVFPKVLKELSGLIEDPADYRKLTDAHVFYGSYSEYSAKQAGKHLTAQMLLERVEQLSLPYPVCYLEQSGDMCWRFHEVEGEWAGHIIGIPCIFFCELSATKIEYVFNVTPVTSDSPVRYGYHCGIIDLEDIKWGNCYTAMAAAILDGFCAKLRSSTVGYEKYTRQIPVQVGHHKYTKSIGKVIRLKGKGEPSPAPAFARTIEWESSWFVRGHWRAHPGGMGKDRNGIYNQNGYTWVKHHVRGNKDAEPERKIYLG